MACESQPHPVLWLLSHLHFTPLGSSYCGHLLNPSMHHALIYIVHSPGRLFFPQSSCSNSLLIIKSQFKYPLLEALPTSSMWILLVILSHPFAPHWIKNISYVWVAYLLSICTSHYTVKTKGQDLIPCIH